MNCLNFNCDIRIKENPLNLDINNFLEMAVRNNPKRRFLFVSKPLGKHLPCKPKDMDELGRLIVEVYKSKNIKANSGTVISFAETGTAIGHSVFDYLPGNYEFIHTTREEVEEYQSLEFLEEHSHATDHKLYYENLDYLKDGEEVILVDDEITTANTCMNIIRKIQSIYPKKRYTICSILNWMEEESFKKIREIEQELNCTIDCVYLFKGNFEFSVDNIENSTQEIKNIKSDKEIKVNYINLDMNNYVGNKNYIKYSGRFGVTKEEQSQLKKIVKRESSKLNIEDKDSRTLFLGSEEFMYIPMLFAKEKDGEVYYHSTSRSPIIEIDRKNYPIKSKFEINSFYNSSTKNYVYNLDKWNYDECFLFVELKKEEKEFETIINTFKQTNVKKLNIVCCR